jgi:hypothetical protein
MSVDEIANLIKTDLETYDPQEQFVLDAIVNGEKESQSPVGDAVLQQEIDTIIDTLRQEDVWEDWPEMAMYEVGLDDGEDTIEPTESQLIDYLKQETLGWYLGVLGEHDGASFSQWYHFNIDKYDSVLIVRRDNEVATRIVEQY